MITDRELVAKYSRQAPRYTSYPSALHFTELEHTSHAEELLRPATLEPGPVSLYLHIPFCSSLCWYCGCTKIITRRPGDSSRYLSHLYLEMERMAARLHPDHEVVQIHFGGGTPTFLSAEELRETGERIHSLFKVGKHAEYAVEIDPRRLTKDHVSALRDSGCNRVSIGVQDVHEDIQQAINRIQPMEINRRVTDWFRQAEINHINVDLIYGLPLQNAHRFEQTLNEVLTLSPDRFAIFNYAHVPWMMPSQKLLDRHPMPDADEKFAMLRMMIELLTSHEYDFIGMDHFAKKDDELAIARQNGTLQRNFQGYSTHAHSTIIGLGMSSISQLPDGYLQSVKDLDAWYERIKQRSWPWHRGYHLSEDDHIRRDTITRIMCDLEVDFTRVSARWNIDAEAWFEDAMPSLHEMAEDGLVTHTPTGFRVTDTGRLFLRNIATAFDAYHARSEFRTRYSRTV